MKVATVMSPAGLWPQILKHIFSLMDARSDKVGALTL